MHNQKNIKPELLATLFIIIVAAIRVGINSSGQLHPLTSFSPIGAMALFGGAYYKRSSWALLVPLITLFVSDTVLALTVYRSFSHGLLYGGWYWVYGAFALMVLAGRLLLKKVTVTNLLLAVMVITAIHWVVTDLGVWLHGYPHTMAGWVACLTAAIPFERNFLLGSLFYSIVLFGGFEWVKRHGWMGKPLMAS
ncbi:MAG TPA: DUF6580 family putative transport protein [Chitinophagaceae bacterium]|nr:DUF6580 family putative transport protein [Chitinophagaceae bacterium]